MPDIPGAYCSVKDIEDVTKPPRPYDNDSNPTITQVENRAKWVKRRLDQAIRGAGILMPVTNVEVLDTLRDLNATGTAVWVERFLHQEEGPNASAYAQWLEETYNKDLETLQKSATLEKEATTEERIDTTPDDLISRAADLWDLNKSARSPLSSSFQWDQEF